MNRSVLLPVMLSFRGYYLSQHIGLYTIISQVIIEFYFYVSMPVNYWSYSYFRYQLKFCFLKSFLSCSTRPGSLLLICTYHTVLLLHSSYYNHFFSFEPPFPYFYWNVGSRRTKTRSALFTTVFPVLNYMVANQPTNPASSHPSPMR